MSEPTHEHKYAYQGLVYCHFGTRPGSGAQYRQYGDLYFCEVCLAQKVIPRKFDHDDNSYRDPQAGATYYEFENNIMAAYERTPK